MLLSLLRAGGEFWPTLFAAAAASAMDVASASEKGGAAAVAAASSTSDPACSGLADCVSLVATRCRIRSRMTVLKLLKPLLLAVSMA